ncbi:hypothetical protein C8Q72DRAFT_799438 [Fomitopsis betulina]|nr:hypothetical protein C8Q72DRAFT_799438 [Fomitopsis betulina]
MSGLGGKHTFSLLTISLACLLMSQRSTSLLYDITLATQDEAEMIGQHQDMIGNNRIPPDLVGRPDLLDRELSVYVQNFSHKFCKFWPDKISPSLAPAKNFWTFELGIISHETVRMSTENVQMDG